MAWSHRFAAITYHPLCRMCPTSGHADAAVPLKRDRRQILWKPLKWQGRQMYALCVFQCAQLRDDGSALRALAHGASVPREDHKRID